MTPKQAKRITWMRVAVITAALAFVLIGIYRGEAAEVLKKATKICLECIGVG